MVALQDGQAPKAFSGSAKPNKNRKGLVVLPPEEVLTSICWQCCNTKFLLLPCGGGCVHDSQAIEANAW